MGEVSLNARLLAHPGERQKAAGVLCARNPVVLLSQPNTLLRRWYCSPSRPFSCLSPVALTSTSLRMFPSLANSSFLMLYRPSKPQPCSDHYSMLLFLITRFSN